MLTSARIAELEQQLLAAQGQAQENYRKLGEASTELATTKEALTTITTERDSLRTNLATITTERDAARTELQTERTNLETTISTQVTQRLAAAGIDPIKRDTKAIVDNPGGGKASGTARERLASAFNQQIQK